MCEELIKLYKFKKKYGRTRFTVSSPKRYTKLKWFVLISLSCTGILGGIIIFRKPQKIEAKKIIATPVKYRQLSNSPTVKPIKAKKNVTIRGLNGTGISGQAGLVVKALEMSGYNLTNIKIANAETIDHSVTMITSHADLGEIVIDIKDALKPMFPEITDGIPNTNPNDDGRFDVVIVTGSTKSLQKVHR